MFKSGPASIMKTYDEDSKILKIEKFEPMSCSFCDAPVRKEDIYQGIVTG